MTLFILFKYKLLVIYKFFEKHTLFLTPDSQIISCFTFLSNGVHNFELHVDSCNVDNYDHLNKHNPEYYLDSTQSLKIDLSN